jgi:hypothetical protein
LVWFGLVGLGCFGLVLFVCLFVWLPVGRPLACTREFLLACTRGFLLACAR